MTSSAIVPRHWNYCNILRDDGLSYGDYVEQLTFLLFLKMADEQSRPPFNKPSPIPENNLDIFWLKDELLEDSANLPAPDVIAAEIVEDLEAGLEQFAEIAGDLGTKPGFRSCARQTREAQPFRSEVDGFLPLSRYSSAVLGREVKPHRNEIRKRKMTLNFTVGRLRYSRIPPRLRDCRFNCGIRAKDT